ncbi:hypothetical protein DEU56DRAFT_764036 [Suillus clintonianus]|uniref:uncharacterized protein n=1 Tax=Suillus clintonianus TaxID=1904413 RepID=UPI001B87ABCF|nr:uncharacterized protein DEU56DRAFT_764036 [Suillus clintonianus]KAG2157331.1 hypothetical protein DEU56DRAFT_764036 [Suillus clintonianus]
MSDVYLCVHCCAHVIIGKPLFSPLSPSPAHLTNMDTSELFDDRKSDVNAPPSYDAVPTSALSTDYLQCRPPSIFSRQRIKQTRTTVLSLIRDMVSAPDFTPSSVVPIVDACAASLPAAEFTNLLQTSNIEGHTALYWAIVNNRREALVAFFRFIPKYTSTSYSDLRLACMATSDHALFMNLKLYAVANNRDEPLKRSLGCPPDEIEVHGGNSQNQFTVDMQIRMFQKRLRIAQKMVVEFVAKGRIWFLLFDMGHEAKWHIKLCLCQHSLPARPNAVLLIQAQNGQHEVLKIGFPLEADKSLAPEEYITFYIRTCTSIDATLGDWLMYNDTIYTDSDGTLHAKLEVTLP